jgi:hypothetical protein
LLGPIIGGVLTTYATWRWCFYINLPVNAIVATVMVFIHIPQTFISNTESHSLKAILQSLDLPGFFLFAPTAVTFLLALEWGGVTYPWSDARIIALFCLSGALLATFLVWEHRCGATAMIPLQILGNRIVYSSCITSFFFFSGMLVSAYYLPMYFQAVTNVTAIRSAIYTLPGILPQILFSLISGYLGLFPITTVDF